MRGIRVAVMLVAVSGCALPIGDGSRFPDFGDVTPPVDAKTLLIWGDTTGRNFSRPAVDAARFYVMNGSNLVARNRDTGARLWQVTVPIDPNQSSARPGLTAVAGRVIVTNGLLTALDAGTGAVLWRFTQSVGESPGFTVPAIDGSSLYAGSWSGHLYGVDLATGVERWATSLASGPGRVWVLEPVVRDGVVYAAYSILAGQNLVSSVGGVAAVSAMTGAILWKREFPIESPGHPTAASCGVVLAGASVVAPSGDGSVYGLDPATGAIKSRLPTGIVDPGALYEGTAHQLQVAAAGDYVFVGGNAGFFTALAASDLHRLYTIELKRGSINAIAADEKYVYVTTFGSLSASKVGDGSRVWAVVDNRFSPGNVAAPYGPAIDGSKIFIAGDAGAFALRRD